MNLENIHWHPSREECVLITAYTSWWASQINLPSEIIKTLQVALLVYDNTAVPRGHTIFDFQIRGSENIAEVHLEIYEPLFQSMVTS